MDWKANRNPYAVSLPNADISGNVSDSNPPLLNFVLLFMCL